jgi:hypothetical protein
MRPGQYRDLTDEIGVGRQTTVHRLIGAQDVGQSHGVGVVGLLRDWLCRSR